MNIVLFEPEIPANTGNIARTCVLTNTSLHLIEPLGFSMESKYLKRAGLDYWDLLDLHIYKNFDSFMKINADPALCALTTKATTSYADAVYPKDAWLLFGKETAGLPEDIHARCTGHRFRVPMRPHEKCRSLNLSNTVAIVLYEALRQNGFEGLL